MDREKFPDVLSVRHSELDHSNIVLFVERSNNVSDAVCLSVEHSLTYIILRLMTVRRSFAHVYSYVCLALRQSLEREWKWISDGAEWRNKSVYYRTSVFHW